MSNAKVQSQPLPEYDNPPVIEVVCGLQFKENPRLHAAALGLFWQRLRPEYATCEPQAPLGHVIEQVGGQPAVEQEVEVTRIPPAPRFFLIHQSPCWLAQVQGDRLLHNWRKEREIDEYPRFPAVYERFARVWKQFREFCEQEDIGQPTIDQLEVTYINHIVAGEGWSDNGEIGRVFPDLTWREERSVLPTPESVAWRSSFLIPELSGRLHLSIRSAKRIEDSANVLLCEITARGMSNGQDDASIEAWHFRGRAWIVRAFAELTDEKIQADVWHRRT